MPKEQIWDAGGDALVVNTDGSLIVGGTAEVIDATLTLDTLIYASGDVLSDTATLTNATRVAGQSVRLVSLAIIDEDDQGIALDVVFFSTNVSLGTKNAAPSISDADARNALGWLNVATTDYVDLGGVRIASKSGLNIVLEPATASRDLYLGTITRGTPTHTANGLRVRVGLVCN